MQITTSVALRRLEWPELPRADLATEFHWLIHDATDTTRDQQDHRHDDKTDAHDEDDDAQDEEFAFSSPLASSELDRSPYRQLLHQPKERRPSLSPAQRAAKKILKLKLELGCLDEEHGLREYSKQQPLLGDSVDRDSDYRREFHDHQRKKTKKPASESAATAGKKKARLEPKEQRELRELHTKQQRLTAWLSGDNAKETRLGKKSGDDDASKHVTYSIEVESRIHDAMESNRDKGLWGDSVASLIAREMTSESVFGGFIPTRRLAFPTAAAPGSPPSKRLTQPSEALKLISKDLQPGSGSPDNLLSEYLENSKDLAGDDEDYRVQIPVHEDASSSLIHERALEIREEAQSLVLAGNIEDALATLQSGIKQLLFDFQDNQDEIQAKGFDFSQDAHNKATRVQLHYKARHRSRVQHIAFLQRVWRNHQVRRAFLDTKAYRHLNAKVIQRQYKTRYFQLCRTRAATRIQTCFRVFQEQKMWIYMHRACRLLVSDERKKREKIRRRQVLRKRLWVKLSSVLKLLWLWKSRFRALTQVQSHWKGSLARVEYAKLLAVKLLWPIGYMLTRRSTANKQRALSILEQQQRFALTKHLRHTFRQLDSNAGSSKNHPNFACQHCFEAFATARAWNLHLRECKRDYEAQLVEWDAVRSDIAFLSQQYVREPTSRLLLPAATPLEFYLGFSTFEPESEFVQLLRFEKRWSSRKRALKVLVNMAICCGVNTSAVENVETTSLELQEHGQQQQVALALVAYLLLPLRPRSDLHPLVIPQLHAFVVWTQPSVSSTTQSQWIFEKELFATLLLSKSRRRSCLKLGRVVDIAAHAVSCCWQRAKTWALSSSILLMNQGASASSAIVLPEA
ncbi:hypothetical protein Gpo141_00009207 [Globisporangium polare]